EVDPRARRGPWGAARALDAPARETRWSVDRRPAFGSGAWPPDGRARQIVALISLPPTPTVSFPLTTAATITTAITSTELDHGSKPDLRADSYFSSLLALLLDEEVAQREVAAAGLLAQGLAIEREAAQAHL